MKTRVLGKTGLEISELGFGGIPITRTAKAEAIELVRHCLDLGVNFFDTANMYLDSEAKLGEALEGVRDRVVLATKTGARDVPTATEHLEKSFADLRTDYIELYQFHNVSDEEHLEIVVNGGLYELADKARQAGRLGHIGFSSHNPTVALKAIETGLFETLQFPFNFVEMRAEEELFPRARELNIGLIGMKPLAGGALDDAGVCFRFLQQNPWIIPIPGIQTKAEIDEIVGFYENPRPLSAGDEARIEEYRREMGETFCRRCGYCLPCPEGIEIPMVLMFGTQIRRFPGKNLEEMAQERMANAENCVECGQCHERCPYELPIPELIGEAVEVYREFKEKRT